MEFLRSNLFFWLAICVALVIALNVVLRHRKAGRLTVFDIIGWVLYANARFWSGIAQGYDSFLVTYRQHIATNAIEQRSVQYYRACVAREET